MGKEELKNAVVINNEMLEKGLKSYDKNPVNTVVRHALVNGPISNVAMHHDVAIDTDFSFNIDIKTMGATNQKSSGRCWIFAACNVLREIIAKKCNIKEFELSQSYVAFYDRLEKINYELESIIDFVDAEHDDRTLTHILDNGVCDGGQWDMFVNVIKKYGIVPKNAMIETFQTSNTGLSNSLINCEMRRFAAVSTRLYKEQGMKAVRDYKEEVLNKMYHFLLNCHGKPVTEFAFEYVDANNEYHYEEGYTPKSFFDKFVGDSIDEYVSVINSPTLDKPYNKSFTISYLGNVIGGKPITHLNVELSRFKELVFNQLKDGVITWFGSDCGKYGDREAGIWDTGAFDYQTPFGLDYNLSKTDALNYKSSVMNHAMVITGVAFKNDQPTKWKIENSWGTDRAKSGYYVMSDDWFDKYVYQVVINKKYLSEEELKAYNEKPVVLKPWDPMGSLAD